MGQFRCRITTWKSTSGSNSKSTVHRGSPAPEQQAHASPHIMSFARLHGLRTSLRSAPGTRRMSTFAAVCTMVKPVSTGLYTRTASVHTPGAASAGVPTFSGFTAFRSTVNCSVNSGFATMSSAQSSFAKGRDAENTSTPFASGPQSVPGTNASQASPLGSVPVNLVESEVMAQVPENLCDAIATLAVLEETALAGCGAFNENDL